MSKLKEIIIHCLSKRFWKIVKSNLNSQIAVNKEPFEWKIWNVENRSQSEKEIESLFSSTRKGWNLKGDSEIS